MCGRFQLSVKGKVISERFNVEVFDEHYKPSFNCAPGQFLPVITNQEPKRLQLYHWGLIPSWSKDTRQAYQMINSRAETITEKPAFRKAFAAQRCLIPANGFFEWKKAAVKQPFRIFLKSEAVFAMAGIWESWQQNNGDIIFSFSIITTKANKLMDPIHDRMPVILKPEHEQTWLQSNDIKQLQQFLMPLSDDSLERYPVSTRINSANQNDEKLLFPVDDLTKGLFG